MKINDIMKNITSIIESESPAVIMRITSSRLILQSNFGDKIVDVDTVPLGFFTRYRVGRAAGRMVSDLQNLIITKAMEKYE